MTVLLPPSASASAPTARVGTRARRSGRDSSPPDPVAAYARSVLAGETVANRSVRLACQRHLDDLDRGAERGLRYDAAKAARAIAFFAFLRLAEGPFEGKPFVLSSWQAFIIGSLFG